MARSRLVRANRRLAKRVTGLFERIEAAVVGGYKRVEDAFVDRYLTREGETAAEAKARLKQEQAEREDGEVPGERR